MAAHENTIRFLEQSGWVVDHEALTNRYQHAGTVSPMRTRNGVEYCRVHHGKCVNSGTYQITTVMARRIENV